MGGQREERLRGQQEMGHRIITAELLSGAELITTFFASTLKTMDKWILINEENFLFRNLLELCQKEQ